MHFYKHKGSQNLSLEGDLVMNLFRHDESGEAFFTGDDYAWEYCHQTHPSDLPSGQVIENVGLSHSTVLPSLDFETYSEAGYSIDPVTLKVKGAGSRGKGGLPVVGTPNYVTHPSAEILSAAYDLKEGLGRRLWVPGSPPPQDLLDHVANGGMIEAWNSTFEWWVWNVIGVRKHSWPPLPLEQTACVMSRARRFALPGGLDNAAKVLGTVLKEKEGENLIQKLTRPHTPTKNRLAIRRTPETNWPEFAEFYKYNIGDVLAEDEAAARIPDLTPAEREAWLVDQTINARGVQVDVETLDAALYLLDETTKRFTLELATITGGAVGSVSEVAKFVEWMRGQGVPMADMTADTVDEALKDPLVLGDPRRALEIRQALGSANIKKLLSMKRQVNSDGRLRDQYMWCGASTTGRASAGGVQLQNLTAKGPKSKQCDNCGRFVGKACEDCPECMDVNFTDCNDWKVEAVEYCASDIRRRNLNDFIDVWGDPITALCGCLRGLLVAAPGKKLICVDFSAIEAVAAACVSRCQWRIDVFSTHGKIYEQSAANATGTPFEEILQYKKDNGMHHPARKTIGKVRELAAGYGGWIGAFLAFGAGDFMNEEEIKADILKWRAESPEIERMWGGQYSHCGPGKWDYKPELFGLEGAAIQAIQNPGKCFACVDFSYAVKSDVLFCRLPSGRFLHYHRPRLTRTDDKLRRDMKRQYDENGKPHNVRVHDTWQITFEGWNSNPQKGPTGWHRLETYGGRLFENVVQAVSADIQFDALKRCEQAGYSIVMHTHDEGCAEVPQDFGSVDEMCAIMTERPTWASWWPLRAAGWTHQRYQKD